MRKLLQLLGSPAVVATVEIVFVVGKIIGAILIDECTDDEDEDGDD